MNWLHPAMAFTSVASALLAGTFFYVWCSFIRRRYVLLWSLAWAAAIPHILFVWLQRSNAASHLTWGSSQVFLVLNAMLMVAGCFDFVHHRIPVRAVSAVGALVLLWAALGPLVTADFAEVTFPAAALLGLSYLATAHRFFRLSAERGTRGARVVAVLFALAGLHEFDYPLLGDAPWAAPAGYTLAAVLAIAMSLCLLIMILEESRQDAERERARVRAILDNLPVGVLVTSTEGELLLANSVARALTGRALAGMSPLAAEAELLRLPDGAPCAEGELPLRHALTAGEAALVREYSLLAPDGTSRALLVNTGPVRDEKGQRLGAVVVLQDVEDHKRMQVEIARAQRLQGLGTLAAGVAHDFNNALTMILGHAEMGLEGTHDPVVRQQLEIISRVAADSAAIVRRIQEVARTRVVRDSVVFDLSMVVREVIDIARPRWRDEAQADGVSYDVHTDLAHEVPVLGQQAELREGLLNIVFNALDAMPSGGVLSLSVSRRQGEAVLVVTDSGNGMSTATKEHIFDPFFTTKGLGGTGLGLALVFSIVQRHDGRIEVDSQIGKGTTFTLRFPLATPAKPSAAKSASAEETPRLRLLVVDDESLVRSLMGTIFEKAGHEVVLADSGAQAVALVARREFDVVLTDLGMPGMNGWEVAASVRRLRSDAPVVLVTGWGDSVSAEQAADAGVAFVLSKPFTRKQLLECASAVARVPVAVGA